MAWSCLVCGLGSNNYNNRWCPTASKWCPSRSLLRSTHPSLASAPWMRWEFSKIGEPFVGWVFFFPAPSYWMKAKSCAQYFRLLCELEWPKWKPSGDCTWHFLITWPRHFDVVRSALWQLKPGFSRLPYPTRFEMMNIKSLLYCQLAGFVEYLRGTKLGKSLTEINLTFG